MIDAIQFLCSAIVVCMIAVGISGGLAAAIVWILRTARAPLIDGPPCQRDSVHPSHSRSRGGCA